jgi:pimeloyl-ACP methyl ester carboxylesterase
MQLLDRPEALGTPGDAWIDGVRLHFVEAGSGPPVILLHGFPEFWYSWRHQIPALAAAGYHALAPDMRGYDLSDKPEGVEAYRIDRLAADVAGLVRYTGAGKAVIVGHDWGGVVAWAAALRHPEVVDKLVILNAPHPAAYRREVRRLRQMLKSWYILFFQLPWLPELLIRLGDFAALRRTFRTEPARPGAFTAADVERYRHALARPGALTAALNYYRALFRHFGDVPTDPPPLRVPTMVIWGERDRYLDIRCLDGLERWVPGVRVERLPGATHWVQHDEPERVNRLLQDFLAEPSVSPLPAWERGPG